VNDHPAHNSCAAVCRPMPIGISSKYIYTYDCIGRTLRGNSFLRTILEEKIEVRKTRGKPMIKMLDWIMTAEMGFGLTACHHIYIIIIIYYMYISLADKIVVVVGTPLVSL